MTKLRSILSAIIDFLRTPAATLLVLLAALLAQLPHSATVFHRVSTSAGPDWAQWPTALLFAVGVELAVLVFVIRRRIWESWTFAAFSVAVNVAYYWQPAWVSAWYSAIPALIVSVMLPLAIALYSHEVAHTDAVAEDADVAQPVAVQEGAERTQTPAQVSASTKPAKRRMGRKGRKPTPEQRRAQASEAGAQTWQDIAAMFPHISRRTAQDDLAYVRNGNGSQS